MGRKAKSVVKQKTSIVTQTNKRSSNKSSIKKLKNYEFCKEWLIEQKNTPHEPVPIHDIDDELNSEFDNELYRKNEPEERPRVSVVWRSRSGYGRIVY